MAQDVSIPDPAVVLDLLEAFRRSKTMFAGVRLGVFDALAEGGRTAAELAGQLGAHEPSLTRLLNACVTLQLLKKTDTQYVNTAAAAAYLCRNSPRRLTGYINFSNDVTWQLWSHLEDAIREGTHRWQQTYGWEGPIFSHFFRTDESLNEFLMGMHGFGLIGSPQVAGAFDLTPFRRMVDLGGATGHLVIAACERYPHLRGVVFDLPQALPLARQMVAASPAAARLELVGGDFFKDDLPEGDLFALGRILHDWTDDKCRSLLSRIFERLPAGGGVLIVEKLLLDDKDGPRWASMQDLNMLACTEGRERTLAEYEELLHGCGFDSVRGARTPAPVDAILASKPGLAHSK